MLNYSATATQVVTCSRCFLQRFNPGPRDSIWAFYSLLGAVAMGLCMWSAVHVAPCMVKQFVCAEFGIRAEKCQERGEGARNMMKHAFTSLSLWLLLFLSPLFTLLKLTAQHWNACCMAHGVCVWVYVWDNDLVEPVFLMLTWLW